MFCFGFFRLVVFRVGGTLEVPGDASWEGSEALGKGSRPPPHFNQSSASFVTLYIVLGSGAGVVPDWETMYYNFDNYCI